MASNVEQTDQDNMVLRTVYFPVELDEQLKLLAFNRSTSKGDLIRRAVARLMAEDPEAFGVDGNAPEAQVASSQQSGSKS